VDAKQLTEGLTIKARKDGSVITVKDATGKRTVAELCVGKSKIRANFRETPKSALAKQLAGESKTWGGGGVIVSDANAQLVRSALLAAAAPRKAPTPKTPTPRKAATRSSRKVRSAA
jgi:hypothetical protein